MAGNFNISYVFTLKDKFSSVGSKIKKSVGGISGAARSLVTKMGAATKSLNPFKRKLKETKKETQGLRTSIKGLVASFGGFIAAKSAINVGANFQAAMADVSAITGVSAETLAILREESLRLAKTAVRDQAQVAEAFKLVASAKSELTKDPKDLARVTEEVLKLSNAAGLDMVTATRAAVGALNQFGVGADQANRFTNVLAASQAVGASEVGALTEALKVSGKIASVTGLSFEQTNAALQVLAKSNSVGSEAGTAFKNALIQLDLKMGSLGPSTVGLVKSLESLAKQNLSGIELTKRFGAEASTALLTLRDNVPMLRDFTKRMTGTNEAERQAAANLNTFNKRMQRLFIIIKDKAIRIFLRLEPVLSAVVNRIGAFFDAITTQDLNVFADNVGKVVNKLSAELIPAFVEIGAGIKQMFAGDAAQSAKNFVTNLDNILSMIGAITTGIRLVIAALQTVGDVIGQVAAMFTTFSFNFEGDSIKKRFKNILGLGGGEENTGPEIITRERLKRLREQNPLQTGDNLAKRDRMEVQNDLRVQVSAEKGTQAKVIEQTKGNGLNVGQSMLAPA